ncbi:hypothetical protein OC845_003676, partial [Tilletia horrida]
MPSIPAAGRLARPSHTRRRNRKLVLAAVAIAAALHARRFILKQPKYEADGETYIQGLLEGSSSAFRETLGMRPSAFHKLLDTLVTYASYGSAINISGQQHLAIFFTARWAAS